MSQRNGNALGFAILLTACGLDAIGRSGPLGRWLVGCAGCVVLIVGLVVIIVLVAQWDAESASDSQNSSSVSSVSHHTPSESQSTEAFWTNFILILSILLIASMPVIYYMPTYARRPSAKREVASTPTASTGSVRPFLALSEMIALNPSDTPTERV